MKFKAQTDRIKEKLAQLKATDIDQQIFASSTHQYQLNAPLTLAAVQQLEQQHNINLPADYVAFITQVGNGGAGPYYGIFSLEESLKNADKNSYLSKPLQIYPQIGKAAWEELTQINDDSLSEEEYYTKLDSAYAGLLTIGDQGCLNFHAIVLNGPHKAKVVNIVQEDYAPKFCFENNFLDWYERWLDEGLLGWSKKTGFWFGYTMGGDAATLIQKLGKTTKTEDLLDVIYGFDKLPNITKKEGQALLPYTQHRDKEIVKNIRYILAKHQPQLIGKQLLSLLSSAKIEDVEAGVGFISMLPKEAQQAYLKLLVDTVLLLENDRAFIQAVQVLTNHKSIDSILLKALKLPNQDMVTTAIYYLGNSENKADHTAVFLAQLKKAEGYQIITTLQALRGLEQPEHFTAYKNVLLHKWQAHNAIVFNVFQRLEALGEAYFDEAIIAAIQNIMNQKTNDPYGTAYNLLSHLRKFPKLFLPVIQQATQHPKETVAERATTILQELKNTTT